MVESYWMVFMRLDMKDLLKLLFKGLFDPLRYFNFGMRAIEPLGAFCLKNSLLVIAAVLKRLW